MKTHFVVALFAVAVGLLGFYAPGFDWPMAQQEPTVTTTTTTTMANDGPLKQQEEVTIHGVSYNLQITSSSARDSTIIRGKLFLPSSSSDEEDGDDNDNNEEDGDDNDNNDDDDDNPIPPSSLPPVVVMAHGMGLIQEFGLQPFIDEFLKHGMAVVTFDYPHFGASSGLPRHDIHPHQNYKHIHRVVQYLQQEQSKLAVNGTNVALWGTSLGGGHVLDYAFHNNNDKDNPISIRAVVANVPHVQSALETLLEMLKQDPYLYLPGLVQVIGAVLKQWILFLFGLWQPSTAWYLPLTGPPGSLAIMQNVGDEEGYGTLLNQDYNIQNKNAWRNAATASSVLRILAYRPLDSINRRRSTSTSTSSFNSNTSATSPIPPILFLAAKEDTLCPLHVIETAHGQIQDIQDNLLASQLVILPGAGHFDVYQGTYLQRVLFYTVKFLKQHLFGRMNEYDAGD